MHDTNDGVLALLQDVKDMLLGIAILFAGPLVASLLSALLGGLSLWISIICAVAGLGIVWQGWHSHRVSKKED